MARALAMETIWGGRENNKADCFIRREKWNWVTQGRGGITIFLCLRSSRAAPQKTICPENLKKKKKVLVLKNGRRAKQISYKSNFHEVMYCAGTQDVMHGPALSLMRCSQTPSAGKY